MADRHRPTLQREQFAHPAALDAWIDSAQRTLDDLRQNEHSSPVLIEDWADLIEQAEDMRDDVRKTWDSGHSEVVAQADQRAQARLRGQNQDQPEQQAQDNPAPARGAKGRRR